MQARLGRPFSLTQMSLGREGDFRTFDDLFADRFVVGQEGALAIIVKLPFLL
jgi:hypothetical protein